MSFHGELVKEGRTNWKAYGDNSCEGYHVKPVHRALGKSGALTGYHWGLTRKRAILGWEAGVSAG